MRENTYDKIGKCIEISTLLWYNKRKILFHLGHHLIGTPFTEIDDEEEDLGHQKDTT